MKKCKQGYYYCYKDKKCKRIPGGYRVGLGGYLRREKGEEKSEDSGETETNKNGNGGNGGNSNGGNGNGGNGGGNGGGSVSESKSGDSSLRDWFSKSKSSDGKPGWVQLGGKYAGKPCAKQPGQKTKPKCGSSKMAANLDDKEEKKAFNRKQRQDPNPNRKGKAINVKTESYSNWRQNLQEKPGDGYLGPTPIPNPIRLAKDAVDATNRTSAEKVETVNKLLPGSASMPKHTYFNKGPSAASQKYLGLKNSYDPEGEVVSEAPYGVSPNQDPMVPKSHNERMKDARNKSKREGVFLPPWIGPEPKRVKSKPTTQMAGYQPEGELVDEGKKDACYHKVKSRYSVWPSAYASGALVKCRKVGAKNWGNKTKNESVDYSNWRDDFVATDYETIDLIKADPIQVPPSNLQKIEEAKKCWKGYKKTGTQKLFGKTYNRCEKIKKEHYDWRAELDEGSAWTKKEGKNEKGGLNEKGRKSYEKENPGSNLKRPSKKVGNKRRASFCARMKGMKKKLTSKKTANDPNSRINKSLRAWNC